MERKIVSYVFYFFGFIALLLIFPMMISGGPGQEDKGLFLLNQAGFVIGSLFCGFILSKNKTNLNWIALIVNLFMLIKFSSYILENYLTPNGKEWLERNDVLPIPILFLIYSTVYFLRIIFFKTKSVSS